MFFKVICVYDYTYNLSNYLPMHEGITQLFVMRLWRQTNSGKKENLDSLQTRQLYFHF